MTKSTACAADSLISGRSHLLRKTPRGMKMSGSVVVELTRKPSLHNHQAGHTYASLVSVVLTVVGELASLIERD